MRLKTIAGVFSISTCFFALSASAQTAAPTPAELATRRDLIMQAGSASHANDHAHALDLALRASRIQMTPSLRMFIAQEQNALGQIADALGSSDQCAQEADAQPSLPDRGVILATCRNLANTLRPRVGHVLIQPGDAPPAGLQIQVANQPLNDALYGMPYVVTPGQVVVTASAPGRRPFHTEVAVGEGANVTVPVALELAETAPAQSAAQTQPAAQTTTPQDTHASTEPQTAAQGPATSPEASSGGGLPVAPIVLIAVGAVGIIAGGVLEGILSGSVSDFRRNNCVTATDPNTSSHYSSCYDSADSHSAYSSINNMSIGADVAFALGGVAVVAGAALLLFGGHKSSHEHARINVVPLQQGGMVTFGATF